MSDYDYDKLYQSMVTDTNLVWKCVSMIDSNKKCRVATSIYVMVSMDRHAAEVTSGRSSIWSIPKATRDNLVAIDGSMSSERSYESKKRNLMRNIADLESENVIHEFGIRDMTAYCMEPFALSWKYCNSSTVAIFPASMIRLIDSMESLFMLFMSNSCGRNVTYDLLMERFATFISEKRDRLYPSIQKKVPKLVGDDYEAYIHQARNALLKLDPLAGRQYVKFKMDALPDAVYSAGIGMENSEFASLIPRDSRVNRTMSNGVVNSVSPDVLMGMRMESADGMPNIDLDVVSDPMHLLQLLERDIKREMSISADRRVFTEYRLEAEGAQKVWKILDNVGARNYDTIRRWISWYSRNYYSEELNIASGLGSMSETWNEFTGKEFDFHPDYEPQHSIVEHLGRIFYSSDRRVAISEACMTYGFGIAYSYAKVKFGKDSAAICFRTMAGDMEKMVSYEVAPVRRRLSMMILATVRRYYKIGTINSDVPGFFDRINSLKEKCGISIDKSEYNNEATVPLKVFWEFVDSHA